MKCGEYYMMGTLLVLQTTVMIRKLDNKYE